jgi:hypothetical protein
LPDILSIRAENFVFYKDVEFDFSKSGLSVIRGLNKDANAGSTNGSGKSLLFSILPNIILDESDNSPKKKTKNETKIGMVIQRGEHTYEIEKNLTHKKIKISKDGKDRGLKGLEYSNKQIQALTGIQDEDELYSLYLLSGSQHRLAAASSIDRVKFFVNLFRLHSADTIRKILLAELREVQQAKAAFAEVVTTFKEVRASTVSTEELSELKAKLQKYLTIQERGIKKLARVRQYWDISRFLKTNAEQIARFKHLTNTESFHQDLKRLRLRKTSLADQKEIVDAWIAYEKQYLQYREEAAPLLRELSRLGVKKDRVEEGAQIYDNLRSKFQSSLEKRNEIREQLNASVEKLVEEPSWTVDKAKVKIANLTQELVHIKEFKDGKCPTCGQPFKSDRTVEDVKLDIKKWKTRQYQAENYIAEKKIELQDKLLTSYKKDLGEHKKFKQAQSVWSKMPKAPIEPTIERPTKGVSFKEKIERLGSRISFLEMMEPMLPMLEQASSLTKEQEELSEQVEEINEKVGRLSILCSTLQSKVNLATEAHKQLRSLKRRGLVLKEQALDEPILKALVSAYSNKGLKRLMVQRYAKAVERQVTKWRKLLFSEDFSFEFDVGTKFNIWVTRRYNKRTVVSDVRKLCGAESKFFSFLLLIALMTLIPKTRRLNILILDEPSAAFGQEAREAFARFLPILNKVIPHIVVITPREDETYEGARIFRAVKHKGISKLELVSPAA